MSMLMVCVDWGYRVVEVIKNQTHWSGRIIIMCTAFAASCFFENPNLYTEPTYIFIRPGIGGTVFRPDANYFTDRTGIPLFRNRTTILRGNCIYSTCWLLIPKVYIHFFSFIVTLSIIEMQLNRRTTMDSDLISPGTVRSRRRCRPGSCRLPAPWPACQLVKF